MAGVLAQGGGGGPACHATLGTGGAGSETSRTETSRTETARGAAAARRAHAHRDRRPCGGTVAPKHEAGAMPPGTTYVVRPGDTLSAIAEANEIAGGWQRIFEQNRALISDPNLIFPDQKFVLG